MAAIERPRRGRRLEVAGQREAAGAEGQQERQGEAEPRRREDGRQQRRRREAREGSPAHEPGVCQQQAGDLREHEGGNRSGAQRESRHGPLPGPGVPTLPHTFGPGRAQHAAPPALRRAQCMVRSGSAARCSRIRVTKAERIFTASSTFRSSLANADIMRSMSARSCWVCRSASSCRCCTAAASAMPFEGAAAGLGRERIGELRQIVRQPGGQRPRDAPALELRAQLVAAWEPARVFAARTLICRRGGLARHVDSFRVASALEKKMSKIDATLSHMKDGPQLLAADRRIRIGGRSRPAPGPRRMRRRASVLGEFSSLRRWRVGPELPRTGRGPKPLRGRAGVSRASAPGRRPRRPRLRAASDRGRDRPAGCAAGRARAHDSRACPPSSSSTLRRRASRLANSVRHWASLRPPRIRPSSASALRLSRTTPRAASISYVK